MVSRNRFVSNYLKSLVAISLFPAGLGAGEICVQVVDPSGAAIGRATVQLVNRLTGLGVVGLTDPQGIACLAGLARGTYLARAEAHGFEPSDPATVELFQDRAELQVQLQLARLAAAVSVVSSAYVETSNEVGKAVDVVDAEEIRQRAEYSILEAIRLVPGVRVQRLGGPGALMNLRFRGMRSFDSAVLIDGFRFRDPAAPQGEATGFLSDLLAANVTRLELLRGSGSSLYGTHATGGVLNIVSDMGGGPWRGSLEAEGGGLGFLRGTLRASGSAFRQKVQIAAGYTELNVLEGLDGNDRARNHSGHVAGQWLLAPSTRLTGRVLAVDSFVQLNDSPFAAPDGWLPVTGVVPARALPAAQIARLLRGLPVDWRGATFAPGIDDPDSRRAARFVSALVSLTHEFSPRASARLAYQGQGSRRDHWDGPAGVRWEPMFNSLSRYDGRIDVLQARADGQLAGGQLLALGYEWERESFSNLSADQNPDPAARVWALAEAAQHSHSWFAYNQLRWLEGKLQVSLSGRLQAFRLQSPRFRGGLGPYERVPATAPPAAYTGDASVAYFMPATSTKFRIHAGNAYRAPSLYERFGTSFFLGMFSPFGDPRLRPERALGVDGGLDQYLFGSRLRVSLTGFYSRLQEVIAFDFSGRISPATDPYGRFGGYLNTRGGLARGVETSVEARPAAGWGVRASYTYVATRERSPETIEGIRRRLGVSDHTFTLLVTRTFWRRWQLAVDSFAASAYYFPFYTSTGSRAFRFDGPWRTDLVASYTHPVSDFQQIRFYVRIENVIDRRYYESGFATPGTWAVGGLRWEF